MSAVHGHVVNIYEHRQDLLSELVRFVTVGLAEDNVVVVVARGVNRDALAQALADEGVDAEGFVARDRFHVHDTAELVDEFVVDGVPDPELFKSAIGGRVRQACASGLPVRVYGEMVALLWDEGNVSAAIELESLWNTLGNELDFQLYCGYPLSALTERGGLSSMNEVCQLHSKVIPPLSYISRSRKLPDDGDMLSQVFLPVPTAVAASRAFVAQVLRRWCADALVDDASFIVTELVTNALLHATSSFRVRVERLEDRVRITVDDASPDRPRRRITASDAAHGRGIQLIEQLSHCWGSEVIPGGKAVWAELARA